MSVVDVITQVADQLGVPPILAVADAQVESGLNPQAVGDQGTSFGLYQLHRGGELGSLTPAQAFDPATNAQVALSQFAQVEQQQPGLDAGWIAALAERPADPAGYATKVDQEIQLLQGQGFVSPATILAASGPGGLAGAIGQSFGQGLSGAASTVGHGIANAAAALWQDVQTFAARNLVAVIVAAIVVVVMFL